MRRNTKTIKIDVYSCTLEFIIAKDAYRVVKNLFKKHCQMDRWEKEDPINNNFSGYAFDCDMNHYFFIFNSTYATDYNTICHEIWHLVNYIFEHRCIKEDKDHEAGAWLMGFIAEQTFKFLEEKKIKITYSKVI